MHWSCRNSPHSGENDITARERMQAPWFYALLFMVPHTECVRECVCERERATLLTYCHQLCKAKPQPNHNLRNDGLPH